METCQRRKGKTGMTTTNYGSNDKLSQDLSENEIEYSFQREQKLMLAISTANGELLKELWETDYPFKKSFYGNPIIRGDELRSRKNGMVIRNTLCRIAAGQGGVTPVHLHYISEKYAIKIEQATSIDYLNKQLSKEMFEEYCNLVLNFSTSKYSQTIKDIVGYIATHISEEITLASISEQFHINNAHLSRKFKKETGFTVSDYVNHQRVDLAKLLFQDRSKSVLEVSEQVGFNSSSYFSKTFKKITDESPVEYVNRTHAIPVKKPD